MKINRDYLSTMPWNPSTNGFVTGFGVLIGGVNAPHTT